MAISSSTANAGTSGGMAGAAAGTTGATTETNPSGSNAVGGPTETPQAGGAGTATGSGSDLHKLATEEMTVTKMQHIAGAQ